MAMLIKRFIISFLIVAGHYSVSFAETPVTKKTTSDLGLLLNSLLSGEADFPSRFGNNPSPVIERSDITLFVSRKHLNAVVETYMKDPIPLGRKTDKSRTTIRADKLLIRPDKKRNVLVVYVKGGVLFLERSDAGIGGELKLKHAEVELAPVCKPSPNGDILLETRVRCVNLDIEGTSPVIDISIARLLQDLYLDKNPVETVNLTDMFPYLKEKNGRRQAKNRLAQASVVMLDNGIEIRTIVNQ